MNDETELHEILGSQMFLLKEDMGISERLRQCGTTEWACPDIVQEIVKPGWVCVDVGANLGFYALLEARLAGKAGKVFAIEPISQNYKTLIKSIQKNNYDNAYAFRLALGDKSGEAEIRVSVASNGGNMFDEGKASGDGIRVIAEETIGKETVPVVTLDEFVQHDVAAKEASNIDFLRMDTEGFEPEIIAGGQETLARMKPDSMLFIEFHQVLFADPIRDLKPTVDSIFSHGFSPYKLVLGEDVVSDISNEEFLRLVFEVYPKGWALAFFRKN